MTYLDLITQQVGNYEVVYLGGDTPTEAPVSINPDRPILKSGNYINYEGQGEGNSWQYASSRTRWGTTTSPSGAYISFSAWVYFPVSETSKAAYLISRGSGSYPSSASGAVYALGPSTGGAGTPGGEIRVGTSIWATGIFEFEKWHHIAMRESNMSTDSELYVDGVLVGKGLSSSNYRNAILGHWSNTSTLTTTPDPAEARIDHLVMVRGLGIDDDGKSRGVMTPEHIAEQIAYFTQPEEVLETPVPATAAGEMPDAAFDNASHVSVSAPAATASAITNEAVVSATRDPNTKRLLSPSVRLESTGAAVTAHILPSGVSGNVLIDVPLEEAKNGPTDILQKVSLHLRRSGAGTYFGKVSAYDAATGVLFHERSGTRSEEFFDIPAGVSTIRLTTTNTAGSADFDNPGLDDEARPDLYSKSAFYVTVLPAAGANAEPATATALMVSPDVSMLNSVSIGAVTATASAEMPGGYIRDANINGAVMDVSASMGRGYFRSDRRVTVDAMEAGGFMYESTDHRVEKEMTINVSNPARARAGSLEPAAVNDKEIDINLGDPYWNRVARRSTEGPLPPSANWWFRLNQREGNFAQRLNSAGTFVTNPPQGYINGYNIEGDFSWGAAGPNGKRGLIARDAVFGRSTTGSYDQYTPTQHSVEYTVRVEPGHTGRMEIARGRERHFSGLPGSPDRTFYTGIHDGKVYFSGSSIKRIDDGEWHHVVVTTTQTTYQEYHNQGFIGKTQINHAIYIDGELDRMLTSTDNIGGTQGFVQSAAPVRFLGGDTEYPFQGEILDIVTRGAVLSHEVKELYLDMFGYKAIRAGAPVEVTADSYQGHKALSSMRRMLLVSWMPTGSEEFDSARIGTSAHNDDGYYQYSTTARAGQIGPALGYGWDDELDIGRYHVTVVQPNRIGQYNTALKPEVLERNQGGQFTDDLTGRKRLIHLTNDIDLSQFDVIAFQSYPNPQYRDMYERKMYEDFLDSVNEALAQGSKLWVNDPRLAADLGWVTDIDEVPVLGRDISGRIFRNDRNGSVGGPDVRGYEVAPFIGLEGGKFPKPPNGALPVIKLAIPEGSQHGLKDIWGGDLHHNNGYRVVNEIEGLTDIPSWELEEMYWRDRTEMLPQDDKSYQGFGYRLENRTGDDFEWGPADGSDNYPFKKESKGTGLKVGDEFYNYLTFTRVTNTFWRTEHWLEQSNERAGRITRTWAVPPGHLRVGTPVTTFRSTLWNDFGDEVANPYRNHIRNFVIRPGDRLPDGRKIKGYAYVDVAEHPSFDSMAGLGIRKQLTDGPGTGGNATYKPENEYTFEWDWSDYNRRSFTSRGNVTSVQVKFYYGPRVSGGAVSQASKGEKVEWALPLAPTVSQRYSAIALAHQTWNTRGMSWLTLVDAEDTEVALGYQEGSMTAEAEMLSPMVDVEFDNVISVGAAQASARIVDPGETVIKSTNVVTYAATARGTMMGLQGGYMAEAATSFGDMPQNIRRPLGVEDVLFFTVSFTQETIYVRMEEN